MVVGRQRNGCYFRPPFYNLVLPLFWGTLVCNSRLMEEGQDDEANNHGIE